MVIAHHLIWSAYGCWLPNDPRGSMSTFIDSEVIFELGNLHHGRKPIQPASRDIRAFYDEAKGKLKYPLLELRGPDIPCIAGSFAEAIEQLRYTCYACAIMPDHVHILCRKHKHTAEDMIANLQQVSRAALHRDGARTADHPVWGGPGWKVFLDTPADVRRTIDYVERNPLKRGMPPQSWAFVKEYDGWPLHPGHDPNSPYARRLRGRGD